VVEGEREGFLVKEEARGLLGESRRGLEQGEMEQAASEERCLGVRRRERRGASEFVFRH
jgi:hypothetical protein